MNSAILNTRSLNSKPEAVARRQSNQDDYEDNKSKHNTDPIEKYRAEIDQEVLP